MKSLDVTCFSYVAAARVLEINEYPPVNYGTPVNAFIDSIAADGPMVAIAAANLGLRAGFIGNQIGNDADADRILDSLARSNVEYFLPTNKQRKTPFIIILSDQSGNREWLPYVPTVNQELLASNLELMLKASFGYVDFYPIIQEASLRVLGITKINHIPTLINLGGTPPELLPMSELRENAVTIVQTNLDERHADDAGDLAVHIMTSISPRVVIVTLGSKGAIALHDKQLLHAPAYALKTRHVHGAGAAFSAGFLYAFIHKYPIEDALKMGCALGSLSCTVEQGFATFSLAEIQKLVNGSS